MFVVVVLLGTICRAAAYLIGVCVLTAFALLFFTSSITHALYAAALIGTPVGIYVATRTIGRRIPVRHRTRSACVASVVLVGGALIAYLL